MSTNISQDLTLCLGYIILILGIPGGVLNLVVFFSLKTFRTNSCAFYLTVMSFANLAHLSLSFLRHFLTNGYGIDWASRSTISCKFLSAYLQFWLLTSFSCMCLATVDQFLATCFNPFWHRWGTIKVARRISLAFACLWILHGIPSLCFSDLVPSTVTPNATACAVTNAIFGRYLSFGYVSVFMGSLPLTIMIVFGSLAYYNVRNLAYRTVPLVRRALDKQLTQMVLTQVIYNCFVITPFVVVTLVGQSVTPNNTLDSVRVIVITIHNLYFASPFYIYICMSKRFRQQFAHVLWNIHFRRWRGTNIHNNQVLPELSNNAVE